MSTPKEFSIALLNRLSLPVTTNNIESLVAWEAFEGGHWGNPYYRYNPLNTSLKMPGSKGDFIQVYPDWNTGIEATAKTLLNGLYGNILNALSNNSDPEVTLEAVKESKWGTTAINPTNWKYLVSSYVDKQDNLPDSIPNTLTLGTGVKVGIFAGVVYGLYRLAKWLRG